MYFIQKRCSKKHKLFNQNSFYYSSIILKVLRVKLKNKNTSVTKPSTADSKICFQISQVLHMMLSQMSFSLTRHVTEDKISAY